MTPRPSRGRLSTLLLQVVIGAGLLAPPLARAAPTEDAPLAEHRLTGAIDQMPCSASTGAGLHASQRGRCRRTRHVALERHRARPAFRCLANLGSHVGDGTLHPHPLALLQVAELARGSFWTRKSRKKDFPGAVNEHDRVARRH